MPIRGCRWCLYVTGLLCLLALVSLAQAASTVYVQARSAQLRDGKTSLSRTVATVQFGEALAVLEQETDWLKVRAASGAQGWIFAEKTSETQPSGVSAENSLLARTGSTLRQTQASPPTASAGARGLDKDSTDYAQRSGISQQHRNAVDWMTTYRLSEQEVEEFLKAGKLGEYAR